MAKAKKEAEKKDPLLDEDEEAKAAATDEGDEAEKTEKPKKAEPKAKAEGEAADIPPAKEGDWKAEAERTKKILWAGPLTKFLIPLMPGEKEGATEMVQINGYKLTIKKGVMVEIPVPMAEILAEHYKVELTAGKDKELNRSQAVMDALS